MATSPLPLGQYLTLPAAERTWLVDQLIPTGGLVNLFSAPKQGKSYLVLDLARALSQGDTCWLNQTIPRQAKVLYVQLDTPRSLWIDRFKKCQEAGVSFTTNDIGPDQPTETEYFLVADMESAPFPFNICDPSCFAWLRDHINALKPELVVIDTIRETHDLDEDKAGPMKMVLTQLRAACMTITGLPPAILIISHSRKTNPKADGGLMEEGRGANYVAGRADVVMRLVAKEGADTARLIYRGRATGHEVKVLKRNSKTILWELQEDPMAAAKARWKADVAFMARHPDHAGKTLAERGRLLQALHTDKAHETCVAAIRRYKVPA